MTYELWGNIFCICKGLLLGSRNALKARRSSQIRKPSEGVETVGINNIATVEFISITTSHYLQKFSSHKAVTNVFLFWFLIGFTAHPFTRKTIQDFQKVIPWILCAMRENPLEAEELSDLLRSQVISGNC